MNLLLWLFSPNYILKYSQFWLKFCVNFFIFLVFFNIYIFYLFETFDYKQGFYVQIIFIHVPAAWLSLILYFLLSLLSLAFIVTRHPLFPQLSDIFCLCTLLYVIITLITGSFWGKPMWGTWWVWDARLTSVFVLFITLLGICILKKGFSDQFHGSLASSVLTLLGLINIPIIKFSVEWWNTLHQPASITIFASLIHYSIFILLVGFFFCFIFFLLIILFIYLQALMLEAKVNKV